MNRGEIRVRVLQILRESGLSEAQIARDAVISRAAVNAWSTGFQILRARTILQLAEALEARGGKRMQRPAGELRRLAEERQRLLGGTTSRRHPAS